MVCCEQFSAVKIEIKIIQKYFRPMYENYEAQSLNSTKRHTNERVTKDKGSACINLSALSKLYTQTSSLC